jgi:uncharacterized protein
MRISGITYVQRESHNTRNIFIALIVLVLLFVILVSVISGITGWKLTHPSKVDIPSFSSNIAPDYKNVTFNDINKNVLLKGWLFEVKSSNKTIILAHGYGKNRLQFEMKTLDMIKSFLDKNINVLAFDFRDSGQSGGDTNSMGFYEKDDLLGAIRFIKSQGTKHIVLMGFSEGASTSILAAAQSSDVEAIIADSPFSDLNSYLKSNLTVWNGFNFIPLNKTITFSVHLFSGVDPSKVSPINVIGKISPRPILFIHSKDDAKIPVSNSIALYDAYSKTTGNNAVLWKTDCNVDAGSYITYPEDYMNKVFEFLDKVYKK